MVIWQGACHVHEEFSLERILEIKKKEPDAKIIAHPECEKQILIVAEHIGSTQSLLNFTKTDPSDKYIVATESGIIHQMQKANPDKVFIPAPPKDSTCACNDCNFMKLITIKKIYNCLKYEMPEINVEAGIQAKAIHSIKRMLEISEKLKVEVRKLLVIKPLPFVKEVIFLSTPHRGSFRSKDWNRDLLRWLVKLPDAMVQNYQEYYDYMTDDVKKFLGEKKTFSTSAVPNRLLDPGVSQSLKDVSCAVSTRFSRCTDDKRITIETYASAEPIK